MEEAQILIGLKAGDKKAFDLLYDLLYEKLCFVTEQIVRDDMEAEDIAIKSLTKFWVKGADDFETFAQVRSFIFIVARNAAFNYLNKMKTQRAHHKELSFIISEKEESMAERAELAMYKMERIKAVADEIEKLPEKCREAFRLAVLEKMPRPLVAEKLNISLDTVHSHCANAMNRLRLVFSEKELMILLLLAGLCSN